MRHAAIADIIYPFFRNASTSDVREAPCIFSGSTIPRGPLRRYLKKTCCSDKVASLFVRIFATGKCALHPDILLKLRYCSPRLSPPNYRQETAGLHLKLTGVSIFSFNTISGQTILGQNPRREIQKFRKKFFRGSKKILIFVLAHFTANPIRQIWGHGGFIGHGEIGRLSPPILAPSLARS